ncbi:MAG: hydrogenase maturation nickel metallochaperone HypA [Fulvivirga sp.]
MHETSIVSGIMRTLEMEFEEEKLNKLTGIYVKVGILSNIEPRLLHNAYSAYNYHGTKYHNVALHIELTEIKIQCEVCDHITFVEQYKFKCSNCNRPSKNIIQGEEMLIHKVEFED